ncbi:MAG: metalloprotease family protein [Anaerolineae bacterium]
MAASYPGTRPRYGILWTASMVYATTPGHAFRRSAYIAIGLAPLLGLSVLALLGMVLLAGTQWVGLLALCAAGNAAGASGDLWILSVVLHYPANARMVDERDGVRILLPFPTNPPYVHQPPTM